MAVPLSAQLSAVGNHRIFQDEVGGAIEAGDRFGQSLVVGDFDGDNIDDLAIGAPEETINMMVGAGAVFVVYGSAGGLGSGPRAPLVLHQNVPNVAGDAETGDGFGETLASGDFNGDGSDELVVGVPDEDIGAVTNAGAIHVFLGTSGGMTTLGSVLYSEDDFSPVPDISDTDHRLGASLATGQLGITATDDRTDLLIGVPGGPLSSASFRGVAIMVPGTTLGLDPSLTFTTFVTGANAGDRVGSGVAIGDIDNDDLDTDVILGAPLGELGGSNTETGTVWIDTDATPYYPVPLGPPPGSHFGAPIVVGDFINEGYDQLLIGAPDTDVGAIEAAGAAIAYDEPREVFTYIAQDPNNFSFGSPDPFDHFGSVLAVGDFDADSHDDAAFGVPDEDLIASGRGDLLDAGIVQVAYGSDFGLVLNENNQLWTLGFLGFSIFANDNFGGALAAGDFNGDGVDDLAVGVPGAVWMAQPGTGFVQIIYGVDGGLFADDFESADSSAWSMSTP